MAISVTALSLAVPSSGAGQTHHPTSPAMDVSRPENCGDARRAIRHYQRLEHQWRAKLGAGSSRQSDTPSARRGLSCPQVHRRVELMRQRVRAARAAYRHWWYEWAWQEWMPALWRGIARCEENYDFHYHSALYVSTFAISRREYDEDAAVYGAPPWNDRHPPTPREQLLAAMGHAHRFGMNGWGCYTNGGWR